MEAEPPLPAPAKHVRAIIASKRARPTAGLIRSQSLKAVQVQDVDTQPNEPEARSMRTLRRGDCCLVEAGDGEGDRPHLCVVTHTFLEDNMAKLKVHWMYRQDEVAGTPPSSCDPREVFYSVHEDTVEAAAVLHPCTVFVMSAAGFRRTGAPKVVHATGKQRHMRPRPGFICYRAYDTDTQRVLPLPLSSVKANHKLAEETAWMARLSKERLQTLEGKTGKKRRRVSPV